MVGSYPEGGRDAGYVRTVVTVQILDSSNLCILPCLVNDIKNEIEKNK